MKDPVREAAMRTRMMGECLLNVRGFLDTPIARLRFAGDMVYDEILRQLGELFPRDPVEGPVPIEDVWSVQDHERDALTDWAAGEACHWDHRGRWPKNPYPTGSDAAEAFDSATNGAYWRNNR